MPQLDTLRCFAVLGVLVSHLWWQSPLPWIFAPLSWGHMGVQLFFVLSGFLITGILLDGRRRVDAGETTPRFFARQFYARRFLRIFPVYYLTLVVLVALDFGRVRDFAPILFGYVSNLYVSVTGEWIGHFSHLWSLAVEEQFYVVWPFLILLLPRRMFLPLLLVVILLAPATRAAIVSVVSLDDLERGGWAEPTAFTTSSLDCLGLGALLAVVGQRGGRRAVTRLGTIVLPLGLSLLVATLAVAYYGPEDGWKAWTVFGDLGVALVFCWLVGKASLGFRSLAGRLLEARPLAYLGRISYGIYLFHGFMAPAVAGIAAWFGARLSVAPGPRTFALAGAAAVLTAAVSWELFEAPLNGLKRHFPYSARPREPTPATLEVVRSEGGAV